MSIVWGKLVAALEARGVSFDEISETSDRRSVIAAAEITDPIDVAILETEWNARQTRRGVAAQSDRRIGGDYPSGETASSRRAVAGRGGAYLSDQSKRLALDARAPEQLSTAPEEIQDGVIAVELLAALVGTTGYFFVLRNGMLEASPHVPLAMRGAVAPALAVAEAYRAVSRVEVAEFGAESLVSMALGDVLCDVVASFVYHVSELTKRARLCSMPLLMVVSEAERIGQNIRCVHSIFPQPLWMQLGDADRASAAKLVPSGGHLLNLLHAQYVRHSGNREEERLLAVLLRRTVRPYLAILRQWVEEGVLNDPFSEFFIAENPACRVSNDAAAEDDVGRGSLGQSSGENDGGDVYHHDRSFFLDKEKIPTFLLSKGRVAKMVFYSGKYCCLLREYNGQQSRAATKATIINTRGSNAMIPSSCVAGSAGDEGNGADDAWQWTNADVLHRMVESCYHKSSGDVLRLMRSPAVDLMGHLESIKSYFLQQRSDWLVDFLDTADELLHRSPVHVKAHSIRVLLQSAIAKARSNDPYHAAIGCSFAEKTFPQYIEVTLRNSSQPARGSGRLSTMHIETRRSIELLQLEADLKWPLTLVLDPIALKHMNHVFRLLLWVKVCERSLYRWWGRSIDSSRAGSGVSRGGGVRAAHGLKQQMLQFLRQFQFYAAHFVIEPGWTKLVGRMNSADDLLSMSQALEDFFVTLNHGMILSNHTRFKSLAKILDLIQRFGDLGKFGGGREDDDRMEETCQGMHDNFLKLLAELASPRGEDYPQLIPLLTWVDFSGFYDQHNVYKVQQGAMGSQTAEANAMAAARQQQQQSSARASSGTARPSW